MNRWGNAFPINQVPIIISSGTTASANYAPFASGIKWLMYEHFAVTADQTGC